MAAAVLHIDIVCEHPVYRLDRVRVRRGYSGNDVGRDVVPTGQVFLPEVHVHQVLRSASDLQLVAEQPQHHHPEGGTGSAMHDEPVHVCSR